MTDPFQGVFWTSGSAAGFLRWVFGGFDMTCVDVEDYCYYALLWEDSLTLYVKLFFCSILGGVTK